MNNISYPYYCPIHKDKIYICNAINTRVILAPVDSNYKFKFYPYKLLIGGSIYVDIIMTNCGYSNININLDNGKFRVPIYGENSRIWARNKIIKDLKNKIYILFLL